MEKNKKKSKLQLSSDTITSSNTNTEQLNSCANILSCKLINSIQEKRKKLQAQLPFNSIHKKCSNDNIVCDNKILCKISVKKLSESSKKQINIHDDNIERKDMISSIKNDGKDTSFSNMDFGQDLSDSAIPCSSFSVCDNFKHSQSGTTIYPSEAKITLNESDGSLSSTICTNIEQNNYRKSESQNNICENNSEYTICCAIDGSRWLPKSIYTDCVTHGKVPKERFTDGCKYQNKKLQNSILNRNNVWKRQIEYKLLKQPFEQSCQKEHVARNRSTCSCIAEEEEDCFANIEEKVEKKSSENVCNNTKCLEKISVCRAPSSKLTETATVCEISFNSTEKRIEQTQTCESMFENSMECLKDKYNNNIKMSVCQTSSNKLDKDETICETVSSSVARNHFEKMQTCKSTFENSAKCLKNAAMYEKAFEDSEKLPEVMRVCKEFVTKESPKDITVCRKMFGESKELPEEVVCKMLSDAEEASKETICKKVSDSNIVNQDNDKKVFLNDAKDNLVKENTNSSSLNVQKNNENAKKIQLDKSIALNNFTRQKSANNIKQDEQRIKETVSNNLSKISFNTQFNNRPNFVSHLNEKESWKTFINKQEMTKMRLSHYPNQSMRNHFQQSGKDPMARVSASDKVNQFKEKTQEEEEESQDISKERRTNEEKPRDSVLNRSVKKLIDVIKLGRIKVKERTEIEEVKLEKIIANNIKDVKKSDIIFKNKDKISNAKNSQKINETMTMPVKYPITSREIIKKDKNISRLNPVPEEIKEMVISSANQTTSKLLRIATKNSYLPPTVTTVDPKSQEFKEEFIPVDVIKNKHVDQKEDSEERIIPQETIPLEIVEEIKMEELITPEITVAEIETNVKDISKDTADIPKDVADILKDVVDENKIPKDEIPIDETSKPYVVCSQKKLEEEPQKSISYKCILPSEPKDSSRLITKCTTIDVLCSQKKSEIESPEPIFCKRRLFFNLNECPCLTDKYTKCNNILKHSFYKDSKFEQKKNNCEYCHLPILQCICIPTQYPKSCLKTNKSKFRSVSPSNISSNYCINCCKTRKKCINCCRIKKECRKTINCQVHEECKWYTMHNNYSRMINKGCRCRSPINCINCYKSKDKCCCITFAPINCHIIETNCNCKKTMICLYCDNRQDKCTCKAPIKKCSRCGLPLDVCDCQNDEDHSNNRERIIRKPDRSIQVTGWKPKREIRRYFARNVEHFRSNSIEECDCYEKSKQQRHEELSYQRLNIFSDVMNELQQKMSESVYCA